jgi:DNA-binding transcriptional regulator YiaG
MRRCVARRRQKLKTPDTANLAVKIRRVREGLQLHQGDFARLIGVSQQTVSDWEQGKRLRQMIVAMRVMRLLESARLA